jgi:hypothetical protein
MVHLEAADLALRALGADEFAAFLRVAVLVRRISGYCFCRSSP